MNKGNTVGRIESHAKVGGVGAPAFLEFPILGPWVGIEAHVGGIEFTEKHGHDTCENLAGGSFGGGEFVFVANLVPVPVVEGGIVKDIAQSSPGHAESHSLVGFAVACEGNGKTEFGQFPFLEKGRDSTGYEVEFVVVLVAVNGAGSAEVFCGSGAALRFDPIDCSAGLENHIFGVGHPMKRAGAEAVQFDSLDPFADAVEVDLLFFACLF